MHPGWTLPIFFSMHSLSLPFPSSLHVPSLSPLATASRGAYGQYRSYIWGHTPMLMMLSTLHMAPSQASFLLFLTTSFLFSCFLVSAVTFDCPRALFTHYETPNKSRAFLHRPSEMKDDPAYPNGKKPHFYPHPTSPSLITLLC